MVGSKAIYVQVKESYRVFKQKPSALREGMLIYKGFYVMITYKEKLLARK